MSLTTTTQDYRMATVFGFVTQKQTIKAANVVIKNNAVNSMHNNNWNQHLLEHYGSRHLFFVIGVSVCTVVYLISRLLTL